MKKILIANWKMNPVSEKEAIKLARTEDFRNAVIVPPFPFLGTIKKVLKNASLGAQNTFYEERGAYTGEISPVMLKKLGVKYIIIGHSERRALGESDIMIARKVNAAISAGCVAVLCVGEPLSVRKKGSAEVKKYIGRQLRIFKNSKSKDLIIAYEPIWAIGTGKNANPEDAAYVARYIRSIVRVPVVYGGSTNSKNAEYFLIKKEIAGLLVGGASLNGKEFRKMMEIAKRV